ncbi:hypothetical protein WDU94_007430 [Cyamophila willieti]
MLYADDTALYVLGGPHTGLRLQHQLDKLEPYYRKWKIKINAEKTEAITVHTSLSKLKKGRKEIVFQVKELNWKKEVKYLGCYIDKGLTWNKHISYATNKARTGIKLIYNLITKSSKLDLKLKLLLYRTSQQHKESIWPSTRTTQPFTSAAGITQNSMSGSAEHSKTIIQLVLNYACPVWRSAADCNHHRIQKIQNKYLRIIHQKPYLYSTKKQNYAKSNIKPIIGIQNNLTKRFIEKALESKNEIIKGLAAVTPYNTGGHNQKRLNFMIGDETYYQELQEILLNKSQESSKPSARKTSPPEEPSNIYQEEYEFPHENNKYQTIREAIQELKNAPYLQALISEIKELAKIANMPNQADRIEATLTLMG